MFQPLFQALLAEGVAVFAPNVRGSGGYGRTFAQADDGERRFVAITDVRAAVDFLVGAGLADPERVGVSGRSYGGYLTLVALAWFPELFRVGVDVCGISDFATFYAADRAVDRRRGRSPSTATRTPTPRCCGSSPRSTASTGSPRRCWWCTARTTRTCRSSRRSRSSTRCASAAASPGFLLFDDEGHEVHGTATAWCSSARWCGG